MIIFTMLYYIICAVFVIVLDIAARLLFNWIVAAFCDANGNVPRCMSWFQTFDDDCDAGMRARRDELRRWPIGDTWKAFIPSPANWFESYMNRALWLFRNSCYGFEYYVFGRDFNPSEWAIKSFITTPELTYFYARGPRGQFCLRYEGRWGTYKLGWKAWNYYVPAKDGKPQGWKSYSWGPLWRVPMTFSFNPFKGRGR